MELLCKMSSNQLLELEAGILGLFGVCLFVGFVFDIAGGIWQLVVGLLFLKLLLS